MTDQFEQLFADARSQAMPQILAPGTPAARRTVRRRRGVGTVAATTAVLAAIGGSAFLLREEYPAAPVAAASPEEARRALPTTGVAVVEDAGPVRADYDKRSGLFLGNLTLTLACFGKGNITMVVEGMPRPNSGETAPVELARVTTTCAATPAPYWETFSYTKTVASLRYRLINIDESAAGSAFAYRVATDAGQVLDPEDPRADPIKALSLAKDERVTASGDGTLWQLEKEVNTAVEHTLPTGNYDVSLACSGAGVLTFTVGNDWRDVVTHDVQCSWLPKRVVLPVGAVPVGTHTFPGLTTRDGGPAPTRVAWRWIKK